MKEYGIGGACGMYGGKGNAYRLVVEKPERKKPFG
jgi:hypothetical protein